MSTIKRLIKLGQAVGNLALDSLESKLDPFVSRLEKKVQENSRKKSYKKESSNSGESKYKKNTNEELTDAFEALEVSFGAPYDECKKSFRRIAKQYHSDLHQKDEKKKKVAEEIIQIVNDANAKIKKHYGVK
jgi:hypothetical protein